MNKLPTELFLNILEDVYRDTETKRYSQFQKFSLVCRAWTQYAQRLLFRSVRLYAADVMTGFLAAASRPRRDTPALRLGVFVRNMEVSILSNESKNLFSYVLRLCPNLRFLHLSIVKTFDGKQLLALPVVALPDTLTIDQFSNIPLPPLVALRVDTDSRQTDKSTYTIIHQYPALRHLFLHGNSLNELANAKTHYKQWKIPETLKLYEFQTFVMAWDQAQTTVLKQLLEPSIGSLRILDIDSQGLPDNFGEILNAHGSNLHSLKLPQLSPTATLPELAKCDQLRELVFRSYPPQHIRPHINFTCLQHLSFVTLRTQNNYSIRPLLRLLTDASTPKLRVLSWTFRGTRDVSQDISQTRVFCESRNVRLRYTSGNIPSYEYEELIETGLFPRDEQCSPLWK